MRTILTVLGERCRVVFTTQYPVAYTARGLDEKLVRSYVQADHNVAREPGIGVVDIHAMIDTDRYERFIFPDGMNFTARAAPSSQTNSGTIWIE